MDYQQFISLRKELQDLFLDFIDNEGVDLDCLVNFIEKNQIPENKNDFFDILCFISQVTNNHHRCAGFYDKITQILSYFGDKIKKIFTDLEAFDIFKDNKFALLILLEQNIITVDKQLAEEFTYLNFFQYCQFFYPEIQDYLDSKKRDEIKKELIQIDPEISDIFYEKRRKGENDQIICNLIQKDSVEEFIQYVNQTNLPLTQLIKSSIFETNPIFDCFFISLIEYASFFGSIQIFQFLRLSNVELKSSLWNFAIHSNSADLIHLLEENLLPPEVFQLHEAVKCHHNAIANYIKENVITRENDSELFKFAYIYHNYHFFSEVPNDDINKYYVLFDYFRILEILLQTKEIDLNGRTIKVDSKEISIEIFFS